MEITGIVKNGKLTLPPEIVKNLDLQEGQEITCIIPGKPCANMQQGKRKGGQWQGKVTMAEDFDTLPDDVLNAFYGEHNK